MLVLLADTTCGLGCMHGLERASDFATIELKANFPAGVGEGELMCTAQRGHAGRQIEVWDAPIQTAELKTAALFRCTQLVRQRQ